MGVTGHGGGLATPRSADQPPPGLMGVADPPPSQMEVAEPPLYIFPFFFKKKSLKIKNHIFFSNRYPYSFINFTMCPMWF
jgi:hypothetical protein